MIKRFYNLLALLAIINLFAMGGFVGYLFASDRLNTERVEQMAKVLRGEWPAEQGVETQPIEDATPPAQSREEIARNKSQERFWTLVADRQQREMLDRRAVNQRIQMDVIRQLEEIEEREQRFKEQLTKVQEKTEQEGFAEALQMYSTMTPKLARDVLMTKKEADVVQLFMKMDEMSRKKIANTCKDPAQRAWLARILGEIQRLNPAPESEPPQ
jgi:hypothetical protein